MPAEPAANVSERVLNGRDDRGELFETAPEPLRTAVQRSVAALMWSHQIRYAAHDEVQLRSITLAEDVQLCSDERFVQQPAAAYCSAILVDDDLMLTAGHCLGSNEAAAQDRCTRLLAVFDYHMADADRVEVITQGDVYACKQVVSYVNIGDDDAFVDLALVRLDRSAVPERTPVPVANTTPLEGDTLTLASHGAGLPLKVERGALIARVLEEANVLVVDTDSFAGGSGGALYDAAFELAAFQVRGAPDWRVDGGCTRPAISDESREKHQLAALARAELCNTGWPSERLCGLRPACGDGVCSGAEDSQTCASDCPSADCGDGRCERDERATCSDDCAAFARVPASWIDDPADYRPASDPETPPEADSRPEGCCFHRSAPSRHSGWFALVALVALRRIGSSRAPGSARLRPPGRPG